MDDNSNDSQRENKNGEVDVIRFPKFMVEVDKGLTLSGGASE